jgi:SAM-dependent methyltransferase
MRLAGSDPAAEFDAIAAQYDDVLNRGLSITGETKEYFARGRVRWLEWRLAALGQRPRRILDFGCGTGTSVPLLRQAFDPERIVGTDISRASLHHARVRYADDVATFTEVGELPPTERFDLVFTNGVLHHIPPEQRPETWAAIARWLAPGGLLALWENNPLNPGTRWVMSRVPFDREAIPLLPGECRRSARGVGLEVITIDHLFFFPAALRWLRPLERYLRRIPLGGQYLLLCRNPRSGLCG